MYVIDSPFQLQGSLYVAMSRSKCCKIRR